MQSRERDGMMNGYDLERVAFAVENTKVPVVASSGCGGYGDMEAAFEAGADGAAAGALWQFTEATPKAAKEYLQERGWIVRL